ncbi:hypothetical protein [Legionella genomosp. 1]|uniref:hypothetical protein n=1 Tax=Legionella genomosp. 1 TaxID=1093625 RepID=UPI0010553B2C|nr:hypothetical protein [Legionella genomosp. 1]
MTNNDKRIGQKKIIYTESQAIIDSEFVLQLKDLFEKAILKKLNKYNFENGILTIIFDDELPYLKAKIQEMIIELIGFYKEKINKSEFREIIFIGTRNFFSG